MCVLLYVSDLDNILDALAAIPDAVVERPHPALVLGDTVDFEGVKIVHWRVAAPGEALVEVVPHVDASGASFTTRSRIRRGYAIEADGGRWALVGVVAAEEMYEEAVAMVADVAAL